MLLKNASKVHFLFLLPATDSMIIEAHFCIFTVPSSTEMRRSYSKVICHLGQISLRAWKLDKWSGTAVVFKNALWDVSHF